MSVIHLSNVSRGCGKLKKNQCYGGGLPDSAGTLMPTWLLGEPWYGGRRLCADDQEIPPRCQVQIALYETLSLLRVTPFALGRKFAIADHVGEKYYSPWSFAVEAQIRGPNRNVGRINAKNWANKVPFVCLFAHPKLPLFVDKEHATLFLKWAESTELTRTVLDERDWTPTWEREGFGFTVFDKYWGFDHPSRNVLEALHKADEQKIEIPLELEPDQEKGIYFSSWFTYVCGTFDEMPEDLAEAGVSQGIIVEEDICPDCGGSGYLPDYGPSSTPGFCGCGSQEKEER